MPRFVDANVFIHSYLKPKRSLTATEIKLKQSARSIVSRINEGEQIVMSVVHLSEISNILEERMAIDEARSIERAICLKENIKLISVALEDYLIAIDEAEEKQCGINDALTFALMRREEIDELYSFDQDFDRFKEIRRITR